VLIVAWDRLRTELSDRAAAVVGLFAAEAAVAIERADLMARLEGLNRMLAVQVEALRVSDQLKTDFVSSVSHELRTPLASILGYLDVLLEGEVGPFSPEQEEFLQIVDTNARRLLTLINDLLTLSGLESGKTTIRIVPVDVRELVELYVQDQRPALSAKEHTLQLELPESKVPAMLDPERIGQVITNVLSNAIKFTPDQGEIGVSLEATPEELRLTVRDSGIGIAPEDSDRLFERFFRARNASDLAIPGTGLGLAICKGIVDAHGGSMAVQSELDLGTAITVTLPTTPHNPGGDT
jgi:signal transduction histidine kinase